MLCVTDECQLFSFYYNDFVKYCLSKVSSCYHTFTLKKKSVLRARINESWMLTDFFAIIFFFLNILMLDRRLAVLPLVKCNISNTRSA